MRMWKGRVDFMQGNEAMVEGALLAGCDFFAGYPITPASEIVELMALKLPKRGGKFVQMEDEMGSLAAAIGASLVGAKAMTATSGPGFSLMQENLGFAIMCEVPVVIVDVMRGGPSTGQPTLHSQGDVMQARWGHHGDGELIVYAPWSVQECLNLTMEAFRKATKYKTPVILLSDAIIAHMRENVVVPDEEEVELIREEIERSHKPIFGRGTSVHVTGLAHDERGYPSDDPNVYRKLLGRLRSKILDNIDDIIMLKYEKTCEQQDLTIISYGSSARAAKEAYIKLKEEGIRVGFIRLITLWPFPEDLLRNVINSDKVMVVEYNQGQIYHFVKAALRDVSDIILVSKIGGEPFTPSELKIVAKKIIKGDGGCEVIL